MSNANVLKMILLPSISLKYIILNYTPLSVKNYFKNKKNKYTQYKRSKKFESVCLFVCTYVHTFIKYLFVFCFEFCKNGIFLVRQSQSKSPSMLYV